MRLPSERPTMLWLVTGIAVAAGAWGFVRIVARDRDLFLRSIMEPVTMTDAMSFDDGGSQGLAFRDAARTVRYVCLLNKLDGERNLLLGSFFPTPSRGCKVPVGGPEERAFLGLLERWLRQDAEA